ncbi:protein of unknown function [Candidatus Nitrosocosmicus franklandus]|uniref:Uncharacterized protein n=1 Tax=Candidatus Nitrosocosmicus franklandianus TaxID=1798806 RepID=A0A484IB00_9ARCH|nr:protein of unknown function [Candidatus Nitrosocosmicus franklandus]
MCTYITLRNTYKHVLTYTCMNKPKKLIELSITNTTKQMKRLQKLPQRNKK